MEIYSDSTYRFYHTCSINGSLFFQTCKQKLINVYELSYYFNELFVSWLPFWRGRTKWIKQLDLPGCDKVLVVNIVINGNSLVSFAVDSLWYVPYQILIVFLSTVTVGNWNFPYIHTPVLTMTTLLHSQNFQPWHIALQLGTCLQL